ncbi:MAG TPA: DUF4394 domain-containing protein [Casimicrobiaceae bacterium]|nr:DUF4394 domain-containing protein [Casimicrobiaceae bacterium]
MRRTLIVVTAAAAILGFSGAKAEVLYGLTTANALITFDSATPGAVTAPVAITGLQVGETLVGIDFRPATGGLYGVGNASLLYLINPITGAATQVGATGQFAVNGTAFGFDFNPTVDRIRLTSNNDQNLRLNPDNGALAATDTLLAYAAADPNAAANPNVVGSAYTNNFAGATTTTLYDIDSFLDILVTQIPPNSGTLNTVGSLGFNTSDLVGFDISGLTGRAFASLTAPSASSSQLFAINLTTGAAVLVGTVGGGVPLRGLAASVRIPEPASLSLIGVALIAFAGMSMRRRGNGSDSQSGRFGSV